MIARFHIHPGSCSGCRFRLGTPGLSTPCRWSPLQREQDSWPLTCEPVPLTCPPLGPQASEEAVPPCSPGSPLPCHCPVSTPTVPPLPSLASERTPFSTVAFPPFQTCWLALRASPNTQLLCSHSEKLAPFSPSSMENMALHPGAPLLLLTRPLQLHLPGHTVGVMPTHGTHRLQPLHISNHPRPHLGPQPTSEF